jgi:hypothetical protein
MNTYHRRHARHTAGRPDRTVRAAPAGGAAIAGRDPGARPIARARDPCQQGQFGRIALAIRRIHARFGDRLRVDVLARDADMSVPTFHAHVPCPFPCSDRQFADAIPEGRAPAPGAAADAEQRPYRGGGERRRRLRERVAVQPRVQALLRPQPGRRGGPPAGELRDAGAARRGALGRVAPRTVYRLLASCSGTAVVCFTRSSTKLVLQSCTLGCFSSVSITKRE